MSSLLEMSPSIPCTPLFSVATCSTRYRVRATNATRAPRARHSLTSAKPKPEVPPVMAIRTPFKLFNVLPIVNALLSKEHPLLSRKVTTEP